MSAMKLLPSYQWWSFTNFRQCQLDREPIPLTVVRMADAVAIGVIICLPGRWYRFWEGRRNKAHMAVIL